MEGKCLSRKFSERSEWIGNVLQGNSRYELKGEKISVKTIEWNDVKEICPCECPTYFSFINCVVFNAMQTRISFGANPYRLVLIRFFLTCWIIFLFHAHYIHSENTIMIVKGGGVGGDRTCTSKIKDKLKFIGKLTRTL